MTDNSAPGNIFSVTAKLKLSQVAVETEDVLKQILQRIPAWEKYTGSAILYDYDDVAPLNPKDCPRFEYPKDGPKSKRDPGTRIIVFNEDSLQLALTISRLRGSITTVGEQTEDDADHHLSNEDAATSVRRLSINDTAEEYDRPKAPPKPVLVLNFASDTTPGGRWREGVMGQEAELCYRTSLSRSLSPAYYPLKLLSAIYSPKVFLIRGPHAGREGGHHLCFRSSVASTPPPTCPLAKKINPKPGAFQPDEFPVVSVISVAAIRDPCVTPDGTYQHGHDKNIMKYKIRLMLRIAAKHGHTMLILGALGCGSFHNPPKDVAKAFLEVLKEQEFRGGWWDYLVFAVMDNVRESETSNVFTGNYYHFMNELDGEIV
ncbi:hypothetical protein P171DRAFT_473387 [Karstenula rhodostoma CBS 690.94]|uniref:Microbial-type PARG catalytic domain-containing protein n=1 Tax=Karstenula rhodostoma CBS 690.94 TaxID=1392251 RepID=A0A9P4UCD9_9PLEO|nr:hypothetical protein P171DRAFT_473387 [Karstenula rhodostoma CBS 690.94]